MTTDERLAIQHMIYRISTEAETVEDMAKLLASEMDAFYDFITTHSGKIYLYSEADIDGENAIIGEFHTGPNWSEIYKVTVYQNITKHGLLKSKYNIL